MVFLKGILYRFFLATSTGKKVEIVNVLEISEAVPLQPATMPPLRLKVD